MAGIFNKIELFFKQKSILSNLIAINIAVFVLSRLFVVIARLFNLDSVSIIDFLKLPADLEQIIIVPWTFITYMFTHYDFWHILFNMLWLYWFGQIFLLFFNPRQLNALYILGGLAGALFFIFSYNIFPYFENSISNSYLIGASASVMAIVFGVSFFKKEFEIHLLFIGKIKLIYLALFSLILDLLSITSNNAGGHIAHIGGALSGICYAYYASKEKDLTKPFNSFFDFMANLFKKKPKRKMKVTYKKSNTNAGSERQSDYDYNARKNKESAEIDRILEKIKKSGYSSLSPDEKKRLFDESNKK